MFEGLLLRLYVGFVNVQLRCVDLFHGFHKYLAMFICGLDDWHEDRCLFPLDSCILGSCHCGKCWMFATSHECCEI